MVESGPVRHLPPLPPGCGEGGELIVIVGEVCVHVEISTNR